MRPSDSLAARVQQLKPVISRHDMMTKTASERLGLGSSLHHTMASDDSWSYMRFYSRCMVGVELASKQDTGSRRFEARQFKAATKKDDVKDG